MRDWLLILGAGASVAPPTRLPAFAELSEGVLSAIGWSPVRDAAGVITGWSHPRYPPIVTSEIAPEVLFGTLQAVGVRFADPVATILGGAAPNAVHHVAAQVLGAGGCVWTPNVDLAVEAACAQRGPRPHRSGPAAARAPHLLEPLDRTGPGTLVKFHGTAEAPETLAFTDRELLAPLSAVHVARLAELAHGRRVVLYGYAGADADLADLLEAVFERAGSVTWFEPAAARRAQLVRAFPAGPITMVPAADGPAAVRDTAAAFVDRARADGATLTTGIVRSLLAAERTAEPPVIRLEQPAAVAHARLVERFGRPGADDQAYRTALRQDVVARRTESVVGHFRRRVRRSLYSGGTAAKAVLALSRRPWLLQHLHPRSVRDDVITRACALLLVSRDWHSLSRFTDWAIRTRVDEDGDPNPSDLYYRAHARRYQFRPTEASADARQAAAALADAADPERLAGALYEAGSASVYRAEFADALRFSFQLRYRRGRFAIPRWQAWGAWLEAVAHAHLNDPDAADEPLRAARERFTAEDIETALFDVRTAELLVARVRLAQTGSFDTALLTDRLDSRRRGRFQDDLDLVLSDILIAMGDLTEARRRLDRVYDECATPISAAWARLGRAELRRLRGDLPGAADAFADLADHAATRGATWLRTHAVMGVAACADGRAETLWESLRCDHPGDAVLSSYAVGEPRVLYLMTV